MHNKRLYILGLVLTTVVGLFFVFGVEPTFAQTIATSSATDFGISQFDEGTALSSTNIILVVTRIIRVLLGLLGIIVVSLFIYAGFMWMTSAGDESKIDTAKKTIINATIGLVIIFSAFGIVTFVINSLTNNNGGGNGGRGTAPAVLSFAGSGSLGNIIDDHYPLRDERAVPRNTKLSVTFSDTFDPSSFIFDTNGTTVFGDCVEPSVGDTFDWARHCDQVDITKVKLHLQGEGTLEAPLALVSSTALVAYTDAEQQEAFSFSLRPNEPLGNSTERVWYTVELTNDMLNTRGTGLFENSRSRYYTWDFEVDTTFDFEPPLVESVYPAAGVEIPKNNIVQINFDEPMDPVMVQGVINDGDNPFTNIIFDTQSMKGTWRVSNGYRTVEFIPESECGVVNSCGDVMYCLETPAGASEPYDLLVRTAQLITNESWEAYPFTGVIDMSGNALDGNADGVRDNRPAFTNRTLIGTGEEAGDNYFSSFSVSDEIDRRVPYVHEVSPGVDQQSVRGSIPVTLQFNMPLFISTVSNIAITEYPGNLVDDDLWQRSQTTLRTLDPAVFGADVQGSRVSISHREFGPNSIDVFYYTTVGGEVRSINQNCLYPGRGPAYIEDTTAPITPNTTCTITQNADGSIATTAGCTEVDTNENTDTGCAYNDDGRGAEASTTTCHASIEADIDTLLGL